MYDAAAKRLVRRVMEGYHGTVFAYGMTGTGKTFSMQGTASSPGVIPLAITDIFSFIRETPQREFLLRVSYLEIYNEKINDLLAAPVGNGASVGPPQQEEIKLREDSKRGVYATPLKEEIVQSPTQLLRVIARGDQARRTGSTQFNSRSSRSHAVVQIVVESRERAPTNNGGGSPREKRAAIVPGGVRVSTLSLIDLAGSERAADDKERRAEGAHINKSLLTLGTIISRLSENKDKNGNPTDKEGKHLPYRDSKLTRLLQPALSGNSLVSILCTIQLGLYGTAASANSQSGETINTLKFASRAKNNIVSHAKRAEEAYGGGGGDAGSRVLLERYRIEIQSLRGQLESHAKVQAEKESTLEEQQFERESRVRHEEQMLEIQLARTALKERIEHLNRLILCSKSTGVNVGVNSQSRLASFDRGSRFSGGASEPGTRSLRSSVSQSNLGAAAMSMRSNSFASAGGNGDSAAAVPFSDGILGNEEDDDALGEFADGRASSQRHIAALQADLSDKNRYISTLERRLLQARRSSHSRMSMGVKAGGLTADNSDVTVLLREKDMEINELRQQVDDKDRMLSALRSASRLRDLAQSTRESPTADLQQRNGGRRTSGKIDANPPMDNTPEPVNNDSNSSGPSRRPSGAEKGTKKKRSGMDEMTRMLDEMANDKDKGGPVSPKDKGGFSPKDSVISEDQRLSCPEVEAVAPLKIGPNRSSS